MNSSSFNSLNKEFVIKFELNNLGNSLSTFGEDLVKLLGLFDGSWESIKQKSLGIGWVDDFSLHKFDDHGIWNKLSFFH